MRCPSKKMLGILKNKLNRYSGPGRYYFGGLLTFYELRILLYYFEVKVDERAYSSAKYFIETYQEKGCNGSTWFYFTLNGNEEVFKKLGLDKW